jgi:hypothetical protein
MLETTVSDSAQKLGLQQEIAESGGVDADVTALLVDIATRSCLSLLSVGSGGGGSLVGGANLLIGVVNEILLVRHIGIDCRNGRTKVETGRFARGADELGASEEMDKAKKKKDEKRR